MTYAELVQQIKDYTQNSEATFVSQIDTFITQAEERIRNAVQLPVIRRNSTGNLTASNQYLTAPSDFLAVFSLAVADGSGDYSFLLNKDVNFIRESYPSSGTEALPRFYAIFDEDSFILGPTPDSGYTVELHYFAEPASIIVDGTSWLGDNAERALLYACLIEAYTFMKGEVDVLAGYEKQFQESLMLLKNLGDGKNRMDAYRNGQVRYPVQ
jgi:hypothetical protein